MNQYRSNIYKIMGNFWTRIWKEEQLVMGLVDSFAVMHEELDKYQESMEANFSRFSIPLSKYYRCRQVVVNESDLSTVKVNVGDFVVGDGFRINDDEMPTRWKTDTIYSDVGMIVDSMSNPKIVLVKNQDYTIENGVICFYKNPFLSSFQKTATVHNDEVQRSISLWLLSAGIDTEGLKDMFGSIIYWNVRSERFYKNMLNKVWDLKTQGATSKNTLGMLNCLADAEVSEEDGTVRAVWTENGRNFVATDSKVYSAPDEYASLVAVNDLVKNGDQLFDVVDVYEGTQEVDSSTLLGICINSDLTNAGFSDGLVFMNQEFDLDYTYVAGDPDVTILQQTGDVFLLEKDGNSYTVLQDGDISGTGLVKLPIFPIGGDEKAVIAYRRAMAQKCWELGVDVWAKVTEDQRPPYKINPFNFIREASFGHNMLFFKYTNPSVIMDYMADRGLRLLDDTTPSGTSFLLFLENEAIVSSITSDNIDDTSITSFLVGAASDTISGKVTEQVTYGGKLY
jgi:hypothetical protein